jgi:hypothetical protein
MRLWRDSGHVRSPQTAKPAAVIIVAALLTGVAIAAYRYAEVWTPLQRRYLSSYVWSAAPFTTSGRYELLQLDDRTGRRLALEEELVTVITATGETSFALSDTAIKAGATRLVWQRDPYDQAALHRFLSRWIYHDQTLLDLAQPVFWGALAVLLGGLIGARSQQVADARGRRSRYLVSEADYGRAPAIIECLDSTPRSPAPWSASASRPSNQVRVPIPAGLPASSTRAIGDGDVNRPRELPHQSSRSWPDPFFK